MDIQESQLPGVGSRYDLTTRDGARLTVLARRDGTFAIGVFDDPRDPDACRLVLHLLDAEAVALSELLTGGRG